MLQQKVHPDRRIQLPVAASICNQTTRNAATVCISGECGAHSSFSAEAQRENPSRNVVWLQSHANARSTEEAGENHLSLPLNRLSVFSQARTTKTGSGDGHTSPIPTAVTKSRKVFATTSHLVGATSSSRCQSPIASIASVEHAHIDTTSLTFSATLRCTHAKQPVNATPVNPTAYQIL